MTDKIKTLIERVKSVLKEALDLSEFILCLGVVVQLLIGETFLGWNPIQNIQKEIGVFGQNNFIVIVSLLVLYSIFKKQ